MCVKGNNKFIGGDQMIAWWWAIVALIVGVFFGWLLCAMCVVFRESDERQPMPGGGRKHE